MMTKVVAVYLPKGNSEEFKMYPSSLAYFILVVGYGANGEGDLSGKPFLGK